MTDASREWQPIETAPKDTVVLTECGSAICQKNVLDAYRWYLCHSDGRIPTCADWGLEDAEMEPRLWMPLPTPPAGETK